MITRYKICVAYDGTAYAGWQIQPGLVTIQEVLQTALFRFCRADVKVHGSGRTDAGVHARGQVAHFDVPRLFQPISIIRALNKYLPPDIRILTADVVHGDFHARKDAISKEYRYFIWNADVALPTSRFYHLHVFRKLNVCAMRHAAALLVGKHDFAAFTANPNREVDSTVRLVSAVRIEQAEEQLVIIVCGEGFLYKMVRSIAGWLVRVGQGEVGPDETRAVLVSRERTASVPTAQPQGLFLWKVTYPEHEVSQAIRIDTNG